MTDQEEHKVASPLHAMDFGGIESIRRQSDLGDNEGAGAAPHIIQARYGAMDIEDQLLLADINGGGRPQPSLAEKALG